LLEFPSPSRRIFIGSHSLPPSLVRHIGPSPAKSVWVPRDQKLRIYDFRQAIMVGVPIAEVANTLVPWICWMAGGYAGRLGTKMTSMRSVCLNT
jgi:hypothetical protein